MCSPHGNTLGVCFLFRWCSAAQRDGFRAACHRTYTCQSTTKYSAHLDPPSSLRPLFIAVLSIIAILAAFFAFMMPFVEHRGAQVFAFAIGFLIADFLMLFSVYRWRVHPRIQDRLPDSPQAQPAPKIPH